MKRKKLTISKKVRINQEVKENPNVPGIEMA
jgi:hypothetical protein